MNNSTKSTSNFLFMSNYMKFEITLIMRSKRLKQLLILAVYWTIFTYFIITGKGFLSEYSAFKIIYFPMLIALPGACYAQYFSSIEANYAYKLFTIPLNIKTILYQKYYLYCLMSLIIILLLLPTLTKGIMTMELFTYFTISIGPIFFIVFQSSRWNTKKLDLNMSTFMNWQGNNIWQYLLGILLLIIFLLTVAGLAFLLPPPKLHIYMFVFSSLFVATHRIWLSKLAQYYIKNKYKNIRISDEN